MATKKPKTGGRQIGSLNKTTLTVREGLTALWNQRGMADIQANLDASNETERIELWSKLVKYFAPALSTQQVIQDQPTQQVIRVEVVTPPASDEGSE